MFGGLRRAKAVSYTHLDVYKRQRLDDETVHDYAESIYKEGKYLKSISSKLMDLILLRQKPEMTEIDVPRLVEEIDESVRPIASSRQVAFSAASVEAKLVCDRELIKSCLLYTSLPFLRPIRIYTAFSCAFKDGRKP